jgi:hypothetical protein
VSVETPDDQLVAGNHNFLQEADPSGSQNDFDAFLDQSLTQKGLLVQSCQHSRLGDVTQTFARIV